MSKKKDVVQIKNPKSGHYVKVDRKAGKIINHKKSSGPYKNMPIVGGERMRQIEKLMMQLISNQKEQIDMLKKIEEEIKEIVSSIVQNETINIYKPDD